MASSQRWPPIVASIAGALLIFLVLPNPLNVPQQNPSSSAEYAPVPGKQEEAANANFAQTNAPSSTGIGAGGEGVGALPGVPPPPLPEFKPRQKNCVGNPPRQTEDPLSPPCVPFFEGDNGGDTFTGVTKDEIKVVLYTDRCCEGDMTKAWKPSDEDQCTGPVNAPWECTNLVRTIKADLRFFQRRYQTYGRTVRVIATRSSGGLAGSCASRKSDADQAIREHAPFAAVSMAQGNQHCFVQAMAEHRVPVMGLGEDVPERVYEEFRPYSYGFMSSQEVQVGWSASFICQKLTGRTAKYANDPRMHTMTRKFGLIMPRDASLRDQERVDMARMLRDQMKAQCGLEPLTREYGGDSDWPNILSTFAQQDVTTIICQCVAGRDTVTRTATGQTYFPEWFWDQATYMDRGIWMRTDGAAEQAAFGTTYFWRAGPFREQFHYQAYLQEEPGTQPNVFWSYRLYHLYLNLFQAIQAAGPDLTPESVEQGMFTFNFLQRQNPWVPIGGYGPYGPGAISSYTFVDTGMGWWWDPDATPPGGLRGEGCMRAVRGGLRSYPGEWPSTDADLFHEDDPCTQDLYKVADPNAADPA